MADDKEIKGRLQQVLSEYESNPTQLAKQFKVNQKTLNNHINGDVEVSVSTLLLILEAFPKVSADWLLRGKGSMCHQANISDSPIDARISELENENRTLKILLADKDLQIYSLQGQNRPEQKTAVG
jgi:plasmid maintenance system antidote protein VapI